MRRTYEVCHGCQQGWIWQDRLLGRPGLKCKHCGTAWTNRKLPDLKKRRVTWAPWNFNNQGARWPHRSYKDTLLEPPPGLQGGQPKKGKKPKPGVLTKTIQEHWAQLPEAMRTQCEALGLATPAPPPPQDLPTLIKEHLQSLPQDLKAAVEKIVEPEKPEPTLASKLKQSVGALRQLTDKKAAIQTKADAVKSQYTALLQELKELQGKIEAAQKDLQQATSMYNQQLEKEKQAADESNIDPEELTPENLTAIMASVGVIATPAQIQDFAHKLGENVSQPEVWVTGQFIKQQLRVNRGTHMLLTVHIKGLMMQSLLAHMQVLAQTSRWLSMGNHHNILL